jgi:hypothetical protein
MLALVVLALLLVLLAGRSPRWPAPPAGALPAEALAPAAVIAPLAGPQPALGRFLAALAAQDYPRYEVILVIESAREGVRDPTEAAVQISALERQGLPAHVRVVRAGPAACSAQKAANLVAGAAAIGEAAAVIAWIDADAEPHPTWLRHLVAPLHASAGPAVTTGFRWYVPGAGHAGLVRSVFSATALGLVADPRRAFAWGGSLALRRADWTAMAIPRALATALSDDMAVTRAVRAAGGQVRFVPDCVLASHGEIGWRALVEFAVRQVVMLRWGSRRLWGTALLFHASLAATQLGGVAALLGAGALPGGALGRAAAVLVLLAPSALALRRTADRFSELALRPLARTPGWDRRRAAHVALSLLMTWAMLACLVAAGCRREVTWCGIRYRIGRRGAVAVVGGP